MRERFLRFLLLFLDENKRLFVEVSLWYILHKQSLADKSGTFRGYSVEFRCLALYVSKVIVLPSVSFSLSHRRLCVREADTGS